MSFFERDWSNPEINAFRRVETLGPTENLILSHLFSALRPVPNNELAFVCETSENMQNRSAFEQGLNTDALKQPPLFPTTYTDNRQLYYQLDPKTRTSLGLLRKRFKGGEIDHTTATLIAQFGDPPLEELVGFRLLTGKYLEVCPERTGEIVSKPQALTDRFPTLDWPLGIIRMVSELRIRAIKMQRHRSGRKSLAHNAINDIINYRFNAVLQFIHIMTALEVTDSRNKLIEQLQVELRKSEASIHGGAR